MKSLKYELSENKAGRLTPLQYLMLEREEAKGRKTRCTTSHGCLDCQAGKFCFDYLLSCAFNEHDTEKEIASKRRLAYTPVLWRDLVKSYLAEYQK